MAHYLSWFEDGREGGSAHPWDHWRWESKGLKHDPEERRPDGLRDIASAQYPLIGPYSSGDRAVVRYHCETAKATGIEGLIVLWYGPDTPTDSNVPLILEEAEKAGLKVALCYEEKVNWPPYRQPDSRADMVSTATADLRYLVEKIAGHPAYLRREGQPVIFQFNSWGTDRLGPRTFAPKEWQTILGNLPEKVCYVRQNFDPEYHPLLAGCYTWWMPNQPALERYQERVGKALSKGELVFHAGMVAPGFDDIGTDGWGNGRRQQPRDGVATLQKTFLAALKGAPEIVQVVTWNDFNEGTEVEPTVEHGFAALDAIEKWWSGVKGVPADPQAKREPLKRLLEQWPADRRQEVPQEAIREEKTAP